jgi:hypothetical protein
MAKATKAKRRKPKINPLVIERQQVISEVRVSSPEMIRVSRVKYEGNEYHFVDIRRFWRGYDDDGEEVFHPSAKGLQLKEQDFPKLVEPYLMEVGKSLRRDPSEVH